MAWLVLTARRRIPTRSPRPRFCCRTACLARRSEAVWMAAPRAGASARETRSPSWPSPTRATTPWWAAARRSPPAWTSARYRRSCAAAWPCLTPTATGSWTWGRCSRRRSCTGRCSKRRPATSCPPSQSACRRSLRRWTTTATAKSARTNLDGPSTCTCGRASSCAGPSSCLSCWRWLRWWCWPPTWASGGLSSSSRRKLQSARMGR
mmetsp:Transcript_11104/g.28030  ORF Transcript_11104/g.28030 Transcript_11104/m.28030 type:complete len:207 (-) Transcript_11104:292-912(-)